MPSGWFSNSLAERGLVIVWLFILSDHSDLIVHKTKVFFTAQDLSCSCHLPPESVHPRLRHPLHLEGSSDSLKGESPFPSGSFLWPSEKPSSRLCFTALWVYVWMYKQSTHPTRSLFLAVCPLDHELLSALERMNETNAPHLGAWGQDELLLTWYPPSEVPETKALFWGICLVYLFIEN